MTGGEALIAKLGDRLTGLRGRITPDAEMEKITGSLQIPGMM